MEKSKKTTTARTVVDRNKELANLSSEVSVRLSHLKPTEEEFSLFVQRIKVGTLIP